MSRPLAISLVVLGFLQLAVLGWIAAGGSVRRAEAPPPDASLATAEALAGLTRLAQLVDDLETRRSTGRALALEATHGLDSRPRPVRQPETPPWAEALQATLTRLQLALDRSQPAGAAPMARTADWNRLAEVREGLSRDRDTQRKHLLLTPSQTVLRRFGQPTEVHIDKRGQQVWHYHRPQPGNPTQTQNVFVAMHDGVVVSVFEEW